MDNRDGVNKLFKALDSIQENGYFARKSAEDIQNLKEQLEMDAALE